MTLTTPAPERYTRFSCPNPQCARFNRPGEGHIVHRSWTGAHKHIERLRCTVCDRELSEREGTLMARSKPPEDTVIRLLKCQRWGVCDAGTADICAVSVNRCDLGSPDPRSATRDRLGGAESCQRHFGAGRH